MFTPPYTAAKYSITRIYPARASEQNDIQKYCAQLNLSMDKDKIDFTSSRILKSVDERFPTLAPPSNLFQSLHTVVEESEFQKNKPYVPVLINVKNWDLDCLTRAETENVESFETEQKKKYENEEYTPIKKRFIFSKYFEIPSRENSFIALLTKRPERSTIQQWKLPEKLEPLLTIDDTLAKISGSDH
jgi:hypothetical protein